MSGIKSVFLVVVTFLLTPARGDVEVSCVFMESCILPCRFQAGDDVVIHWIQLTPGNTQVHSYYHNKDQLSFQYQRFRDRTSLFNDQISRGNASLLLKGVQFHDQGRYKCYTSTITGNKETFVKLNMDAPVRKVDIQQVENKITCRSEGIYPEPKLTWSTSPPSKETLQGKTEAQQTEQKLYNISSSLILSDNAAGLTYICTVSTQRSRLKASLKTLPPITGSGTEQTITCTASNTPQTGLVWIFNHSQTILTQTGANVSYTVSEEWRQQVKGVSKSGDLTLKNLSSIHDGIYTCELSNAEETYYGNTFLKIIEGSSSNVAAVSAGVVVGVICAGLATGLILYCTE
ncbi:CD276 antigen-like [Thunnus albacares]|uniref:CD276 antigen-like n=1 Tax=Thunnus albacares TaxID=8236 RepID=UPI001CF6886C|nr:CD276 antigen-like [Thunnus albacares]